MLPVLTQDRQEQTPEILIEQFEEFLKLPENLDRLFELIEGEIVEKMPTEEHGTISLNIGSELRFYARKIRKGIAGVEVRYKTGKKNSRMPDISFTLENRPLVTAGAVPNLPDLAVEIMSPDDTIKGLRDKAEYYLANGTRMVWLVYPRKRLIEVYTLDTIEMLNSEDVLTGGELLPDFSIPVKEIFAAPYEASTHALQ